MELDEFKLAWQSLDRRLERQSALNLAVLRDSRLDKARRSLRALGRGQIFQIVAGVLLCLVFGSYWFDHRQIPHLLIYGLSLHLYGLMFIVLAARTLVLIQRIDYSAPVVAIQQRLAELHEWRVRVEGPLLGLTSCCAWLPFMLLVLAEWDVDIWFQSPRKVYLCLAGALVSVLIFAGLMRWSRQTGGGWLARCLVNSFSGSRLRRAQQQLHEIDRFQRE